MAWTAEERRKYLQSRGYIAPDNDGFFGELADSAAQSFVSGARGMGATINELTGNSSMQDYFQGVLERNQQWNAPEDGSVGSYIGRAVGSAAGSTAATLTAATAGTLLGGPGAGVAAGVTTAFAQTFGDNVQRNREAGYSDDKALGMAFLESGIDAAIENLPFGIVGKSGKVIAQAGRLRNISAAGKRELLNAVGKRVAAATGQKETQSTLARLGKAAFMNGLGEGGEEGLQALNSYLNQTLGGDTRANITIEELANSIAQGFIGGFFLGGAQSTPLAFTRTSGGNAGESQLDATTPAPSLAAAEGTVMDVTPVEDNAEVLQQATVPENNSLFEQLVANAGEYLGIKVDYMDSLPNGEKIADENNGMYDSKNKTLYLNRQSATVNPVKTLGHELKHYLDDNHPELAKTFDELVNSGLAELGQNFNKNIHKGDMAETASDIFADIFARPDTWSKVAVALDEKTPGMGEAFLKVLQDFIAHIKDVLKGNVQDPQAEQLLNNFEMAEAETVKILAEIRRRNGTAAQTETAATTNMESAVVSAENAQTTKVNTQEASTEQSSVITPELAVAETENTTTEPTAKENLEVAATEIKNTTDRYRTKGENPTYYKSLIEVEQAEKAAKSKGQKFEYEKNPDYVSAQKKQAEQAAQEASEVPDNPAVGESFNEFYKRFTPQLESILAKNKQMFSSTIGNKLEGEWSSATSKAIVKAYGYFNSKSGASVDTYVSRAIENAIKSVNRKHNAEFVKTGGGASLNQTNEKGEELQEAVAAEDAEFSSKKTPKEKLNDYTKWKSTLKPRDQKILTYSEQGLAPSEIARKSGIGMTTQAVTARISALKVAALTEEEFLYSRKRIYTGSAADYDAPSLQYIGTGEGQQAYGWGLYGSESKKVARWYAEEDADRKNYSSATVIKYMGTPYTEKELFDYAKAGDVDFQMLAHIFSRGGVQNAIHELEQQVERAKQKNWHPELYEWQEDLLKEIKEAQDDIEYIGNKLEGKRHLYNQTFWPNKDEDLLDWNDVLTDEQRDKILKQGSKEGVFKLDRTEQPQEVLNALQAIRDEIQYDDHESSFFYKKLSMVLGSPKAASEFLYRAGIDGITYIGDSSGVRNYVAFSDKDIQVDEHIKYSKKRSSRQIVPIVRDGIVRDEYADLLSKRKYTVQTLEDLQKKAMEWIKQTGGVVASVNVFLKGNTPGNPAVAEIARRLLLESDVFQKAFSKEQRTKLFEQEQDVHEDWGRTGRAMQLAALSLKDIASVQAVLNKLHKKMKDDEVITLRNQILKELGIDIIDLPDDIIEDRKKLDAVLRKHLAYVAGKAEKFYEYYINAILSGPTTHISNFLGNTANAAYELGIKRFTEALVNIAAGRKDGATFGEFREMIRAFNWRNAMAEARKAYDLEVLDPSGKFLENNMVAIGGKTGRVIRVPSRALKAADAFANALIRPMETAAYAYRMGVQEGLSGSNLQAYIREQLHNPDSESYQWGMNRARELTFQEDPGSVVRHLMNLRESDGAMGIALKMFLPFIKTPYNILRQGMRKGPVGAVNLAFELGKVALGKRKFDGEMVGRVAEQLLAWGAFMAVYGLSNDDDELPILTGTSAPYGSAEYGFKANKIPPYSIRLGDTWYSYQRIEPLATGLAAIADGIQAMREIKSGKDASAALKKMLFSTIKVAGEKSYIDSINEIVKIAQDPERNMARPATNLLSSIMPALIRQTRQAFIEEVGQSKSRNMGAEWWKDQFDLIINRAGITTAIPKVDYFGRDVKKDDWSTSMLSDAGRLLPIKRVEADRNMGNAERLIWNYNRRNPDEEYYPSIPRNTFTHNGVKMYFAGDDYREFAVQSGQLAHKQINNAIRAGRLNVENPTEKDIKLIRKIFTRARKETQDKLLQQKRGKQL